MNLKNGDYSAKVILLVLLVLTLHTVKYTYTFIRI